MVTIREIVFEPARGLRYAELFAVGPELITVYNSMGLSEAPPEVWDALDAEAAATQLQVGMVVKNGPHWWVSDKATMRFGEEPVTVGGIGFRFAAKLPAFVARSGKLTPPVYEVVETTRRASSCTRPASPSTSSISPGGDAFVMQSTNIEPSELADARRAPGARRTDGSSACAPLRTPT